MLCVLCMLLTSMVTFAQEQRATINQEGKIVLPASASVSDAYTIDIAADQFDSQQDLMAYFNERSSADINFRVLRDRNEVMLILNRKNHPDRTLNQWNALLSEIPDFQEVLPITKSH